MDLIEVSCGIIWSEDKVFICRRRPEKSLGGYWEFPGGKVEKGETGDACLRRELREELGMEVIVDGRFGFNDHEYEHVAIRLVGYLCSLVSFNGTMTDHDAFEWVSPEDLTTFSLAPADIPLAHELAAGGK